MAWGVVLGAASSMMATSAEGFAISTVDLVGGNKIQNGTFCMNLSTSNSITVGNLLKGKW